MFHEICIYEAKLTKLDEIEELMIECQNKTIPVVTNAF